MRSYVTYRVLLATIFHNRVSALYELFNIGVDIAIMIYHVVRAVLRIEAMFVLPNIRYSVVVEILQGRIHY
mgnify:CR=1 FL=1